MTAPINLALERRKRIMLLCGSCKATGVQHRWVSGALMPAKPKRPCLYCAGLGRKPAALYRSKDNTDWRAARTLLDLLSSYSDERIRRLFSNGRAEEIEWLLRSLHDYRRKKGNDHA